MVYSGHNSARVPSPHVPGPQRRRESPPCRVQPRGSLPCSWPTCYPPARVRQRTQRRRLILPAPLSSTAPLMSPRVLSGWDSTLSLLPRAQGWVGLLAPSERGSLPLPAPPSASSHRSRYAHRPAAPWLHRPAALSIPYHCPNILVETGVVPGSPRTRNRVDLVQGTQEQATRSSAVTACARLRHAEVWRRRFHDGPAQRRRMEGHSERHDVL
jgi:hypothetical protein